MRYVFGDYTLDAAHYELHRAGTLVRLEPRVFNLLAYLVQHPGRTVTKEELREQLWPDRPYMSDDPLANCVAQARKALGDSGQTQRYIKTPLLCFGEYQAHTHLAAAVCCLANKEAKRSSTLCPSWSRSCT